jgi:hypothetical protein
MKKLVVMLLAALLIVGLSGCASSGKKAGDAPPVQPYSVDLSTLTMVKVVNNKVDPTPTDDTVKNSVPLTGLWADVMMLFAPFPDDIDWTSFSRVTIRATGYNADGTAIPPGSGGIMVSLIYDINGDIRGPDMGPGRNTPLKAFSLGGPTGTVHTPKGSPVRLTQAPQAILFQNSIMGIAFIEVTGIIFHDGLAE